MMQCDIIKIRGTKAYDHIKFLRENEFITAEKTGRTRLIKLAPKFFEYFDVVEESLKAQFHDIAAQYPAETQATLETTNAQTETQAELQTESQAPQQETATETPAEQSENSPEEKPEEANRENEELD